MRFRFRNTNRWGGSWTPAQIDLVWRKARIVAGANPAELRKDACNAWIKRSEYGQESDYGWEIDHIQPVAKGGGDEFSNLQPLHWANNRYKSDDWPQWSCSVSAA